MIENIKRRLKLLIYIYLRIQRNKIGQMCNLISLIELSKIFKLLLVEQRRHFAKFIGLNTDNLGEQIEHGERNNLQDLSHIRDQFKRVVLRNTGKVRTIRLGDSHKWQIERKCEL